MRSRHSQVNLALGKWVSLSSTYRTDSAPTISRARAKDNDSYHLTCSCSTPEASGLLFPTVALAPAAAEKLPLPMNVSAPPSFSALPESSGRAMLNRACAAPRNDAGIELSPTLKSCCHAAVNSGINVPAPTFIGLIKRNPNC